MTNRFHVPVVVTTDDNVTQEQVEAYVEHVLEDLEQDEEIYRTFLEDDGIEQADAERLFTMLDNVSSKDVATAVAALDELRSEQNS